MTTATIRENGRSRSSTPGAEPPARGRAHDATEPRRRDAEHDRQHRRQDVGAVQHDRGRTRERQRGDQRGGDQRSRRTPTSARARRSPRAESRMPCSLSHWLTRLLAHWERDTCDPNGVASRRGPAVPRRFASIASASEIRDECTTERTERGRPVAMCRGTVSTSVGSRSRSTCRTDTGRRTFVDDVSRSAIA